MAKRLAALIGIIYISYPGETLPPEQEATMAEQRDNKSKLHYLVLAIMLAGFCYVAATAPNADPEQSGYRQTQ